MSEITITQTGAPSRSKQAGPCWIAIGGTYASTAPRTIDAAAGTAITVTGKAVLRRATRISTDRETWTLYATGNPGDEVTLRVGMGQYVEAVITGVSEHPPAPEPQPETQAAVPADGPGIARTLARAIGTRALAAALGVTIRTVQRWITAAAQVRRPSSARVAAMLALEI
jgi:hypothetical protein